MIATKLSRARLGVRKVMLVMQGAILLASSLIPVLVSQSAAAASPQLTFRLATSTTGKISTVFTSGVQFRLPSSAIVRQAELEYCTTPLGTCVGVGGTSVPLVPAASTVTQVNTTAVDNWTDPTAFASYTRSGGRNGGTNNQIAVSRASTTPEAQSALLDRGFTFTGLTNVATANTTYYVRIRLYSDLGTTEVFNGATAQSTNQTLTINARVQEVLQFCVGTTTTDSAVTQLTNNAATLISSCTNADGTSVDLGTVDNSHINITPVSSTYQGDNKLAYAMVQTNAQNGVVIGYRALQDTSSGKLKVVGATCSGTSTTDQCFNSQGGTQGAFTSGTENFGMTIAGVNCFNATPNYTCVYANGSGDLQPKANYFQPGTFTANSVGASTYQVAAGTNTTSTENFAWVDTGSSITNIAGSDTATLKVVANEALMIKFGATSQITTPTGLYQAQADFVATPTY